MCGAPPPHPSDAQETVQFSIFFLYACVVIPFISFIPCALVCIAICCSALYCMCICICKALIMKRDIESAKRENTTRVACTHTNPTLIIFFFSCIPFCSRTSKHLNGFYIQISFSSSFTPSLSFLFLYVYRLLLLLLLQPTPRFNFQLNHFFFSLF